MGSFLPKKKVDDLLASPRFGSQPRVGLDARG